MAIKSRELSMCLWTAMALYCTTMPGCSCTQRPKEPEAASEVQDDDMKKADDLPPHSDSATNESIAAPPAASESSATIGSEDSTQTAGTDAGKPSRQSPSGTVNADEESSRALSPAESVSQAGGLQRQADALAASQPSEAYAKALRAWQIVSQHPDDGACRQLKNELEKLLEPLGKRANLSAGGNRPIRRNQSTVIK